MPAFALGLALSGSLNSQEAAAALQLTQSLTGSHREQATGRVLHAWAAREPAAAAAWAGQQAPTFHNLIGVAQVWVHKDPAAVQAWVDSLPHGAAREGLFGAAADANFGFPPEVAKEWIGRISNPEHQNAAYRVLAARWLKADVKAAREWLETAPLSQEVKDQLLTNNAK